MAEKTVQRLIQAAIVVVLVVSILLAVHSVRTVSPKTFVTYAVGDTLDVVPAIERRHTVVLYVRATCGACEKAKTVYEQIVKASYLRDYRVMVIGLQSERDYAQEIGVGTQDLVQLSRSVERLPFTPTLFVMDAHRYIEYLHIGVPGETQLNEIRELLSR